MIHQWINGATVTNAIHPRRWKSFPLRRPADKAAGRRRLAGLAVGRAKSGRLHGPTALAWHNCDINKGYNRGYILWDNRYIIIGDIYIL